MVIRLAAVARFEITAHGSRSDGSTYYDLVAHLRDGRDNYLFGGCAFQGRMDRDHIARLQDRFTRAL